MRKIYFHFSNFLLNESEILLPTATERNPKKTSVLKPCIKKSIKPTSTQIEKEVNIVSEVLDHLPSFFKVSRNKLFILSIIWEYRN
jgi:hypothetical protein